MTTLTRKTRIGSRKDLIERAHRHATDLGPTINAIRAAGATTLWGIAAELNRLGIPTAAGSGEWNSTQVRVVLRRLGHLLPANIYRLVVRRGPLSWEWQLYRSGEPQPVRGQGISLGGSPGRREGWRLVSCKRSNENKCLTKSDGVPDTDTGVRTPSPTPPVSRGKGVGTTVRDALRSTAEA
jgi:hypothetical protein